MVDFKGITFRSFENKDIIGNQVSFDIKEPGSYIISVLFDSGQYSYLKESDKLWMGISNISVADNKGNLLFYTNGNDVISSNHEFMENGRFLLVEDTCAFFFHCQGALVLPLDDVDQKFMLLHTNREFYLEVDNHASNLLWSFIIDMNENDGLGKNATSIFSMMTLVLLFE